MVNRILLFLATLSLASGCTNPERYDGSFGKLIVVPLQEIDRSVADSNIHSSAKAVFTAFVGCQNELGEDDVHGFLKCANSFFDPALPELVKRTYSAWLFKKIKISEPVSCSEKEIGFLSSFRDLPRIYLCFEILEPRAERTGYLFFSKRKGRLYIQEIKY